MASPPSRVRFRVPWSIDPQEESFIIKDADGWPLCYIYYEDDKFRAAALQRLTKDEARRLAVQIERIPELLKIERLAKSGESGE